MIKKKIQLLCSNYCLFTSLYFYVILRCSKNGRFFFFFKQKTAYEIPKRDWSSDVCSSDLVGGPDACNHRERLLPRSDVTDDGAFEFCGIHLDAGRSEERRVGKECRSRW